MKSLDKGFRHLTRKDKLKELVEYGWLEDENYEILLNYPLINEEVANSLIENVIGQGALPVGLLPQIIVDGKEYVVPMMVEEPSVVQQQVMVQNSLIKVEDLRRFQVNV